MKLHDFQDAADAQGRPKKRCRDCGVTVIAWPGVNLEKVYPRCGEGFGDKIAAALGAAGIQPCEECVERKQWLNKIHGQVAAVLGL